MRNLLVQGEGVLIHKRLKVPSTLQCYRTIQRFTGSIFSTLLFALTHCSHNVFLNVYYPLEQLTVIKEAIKFTEDKHPFPQVLPSSC